MRFVVAPPCSSVSEPRRILDAGSDIESGGAELPLIRAQSLHTLKNDRAVGSKTMMFAAAGEVVDCLDEIMRATRVAVHIRSRAQGFRLIPDGSRLRPDQIGHSKAHPGDERPSIETFLEFAVFDAYRTGQWGRDLPWNRIVGRQVPLMSKQASEKWGAIDLLGLSSEGHPVVIELKKAGSSETPLRALLEGAGYAVAVAANWRILSEEIARTSPDNRPAASPDPVRVVVAAPDRYWRNWDRWSTSGRGVPPSTRDGLRRVSEALALAGIQSSFVEISHDGWSESAPLSGGGVRTVVVEPWR